MPHQVTIQPSGHQFTVQDDETVLEAALREGFSLPYGCRNGACGACKGRVLAGQLDHGVYQPNVLKDEEKAQGRALFCRAKPLSDLTIEAKEIGAAKDIVVKTLPCRVEKLEKRADDVMRVWIKLPANERLQFLAGQYVDFLLKDGKSRSGPIGFIMSGREAMKKRAEPLLPPYPLFFRLAEYDFRRGELFIHLFCFCAVALCNRLEEIPFKFRHLKQLVIIE